MRVSELMVRDVTLVPSGDTVQNAARAIADLDSRVILVGVEDRVVGVLTTRDILIRWSLPVSTLPLRQCRR